MKEYWDTLNLFRKIKFSISIILLILIVIFSFQNWEIGKLNLIFFTVDIHLTLLIAISMFLGYSASLISHYKKVSIKEKEIKSLKLRLKECLKENEVLNSINQKSNELKS